MARAHSGCGSSATTRAPRRRKLADAVAHVAADVEGEIAGAHEARIERIHRRIACSIAVVDVERAGERGERGVSFKSATRRRQWPWREPQASVTRTAFTSARGVEVLRDAAQAKPLQERDPRVGRQ